MFSKKVNRCFASLICVFALLTVLFIPASAVTVTGVSGVEVTVSNGNVSESNGTVTVTATSASNSSATTATVTVTNTSGSTAAISFDYSASNVSACSIGSVSWYSCSGSHSATVKAGESFSFTITTRTYTTSSKRTATLTLSSFVVTPLADSSNVTVTYEESLGSVTVAGASAPSGSVHSVDAVSGAVFAATANSGSTFLGWVNAANDTLLSTAASFTYIPSEDVTLRAVFFKNDGTSTAWFGVGTIQSSSSLGVTTQSIPAYAAVFDNLTDANAYAVSSGKKGIVLLNNGTVSGSHTVSASITLLIPRNSANSVTTEGQPGKTKPTNYGDTPPAPTSFRKLTMANGAHITVKGVLDIAGTQWAGGKFISATGPSGFVHMNEGSTITVDNGGFLYAWGYITGAGSVTAESGATVYEMFQVGGWRGGDMTQTMINSNTYGVFPMSQYYVQNIEVPLTLKKGALEYAFASADITLIGIQPISVAFVGGSSSLFNITDGYVTKDYIESEDRLKIEIHGDVALTPIEIGMKLGILGSVNMKSKDFDLPINNNMTVHAVSGNMTINQDVALLPGTQVIIDEGVTCTLGEGVSLYAYDADKWGTYCGSSNSKFIAVCHAPGRTYNRTEKDLVDASVCVNGTIDASQGYLYTTAGKGNFYSTGSGVVKTHAGTQTATHQVVQAGEPSNSTYPEIAITPVQLKNGDGSFTSTALISAGGYGDGTYTYYPNTGLWCPPGHLYQTTVTAPTCTAGGYTTYTCIACGHSYTGNTVDALGHELGAWTQTKAPTCTEKGEERADCSRCDYYETREVAATGHTAGAAATCTTAQTCTVCGTVLKAALGHNMQQTSAAVAPTCTSAGKTAVFTCANGCGTTEGGAEVAATGHTAADAVKENVTATSYDLVVYCSVCGTEISRETIQIAIYSVTITWSQTSNATYIPAQTTYTWSPTQLKYTSSTTAAKWQGTSQMTITVDNSKSTGMVLARFAYADNSSDSASATQSWTGLAGGVLSVAAGDKGSTTLTLTPTGTPTKPDSGSEIILGTVTITFEKGG